MAATLIGDPSPATSTTMHSRVVPQDKKLMSWQTSLFPSLAKSPKCCNRIRETPNLSTNADRSTNIFLLKKNKLQFNPERILVLKALRVGPKMHQSTSPSPPRRGPSTDATLNNSLFLRLYESVHKCTSPLVKHLPRVDHQCM